MDNKYKWIEIRIRLGWIFLIGGVIVIGSGIFIEHQYHGSPYNLRLITGLGILLAGVGIAYLVRYRATQIDEHSLRRVHAEERDERTELIRARAGNRAFWCSSAIIYVGLMWESFAANGSVPRLFGDVLWYYLATGVLIPFAVYVSSILIDQRNF
jgi:uncharacterized membrane protein